MQLHWIQGMPHGFSHLQFLASCKCNWVATLHRSYFSALLYASTTTLSNQSYGANCVCLSIGSIKCGHPISHFRAFTLAGIANVVTRFLHPFTKCTIWECTERIELTWAIEYRCNFELDAHEEINKNVCTSPLKNDNIICVQRSGRGQSRPAIKFSLDECQYSNALDDAGGEI